MKVGSLVSLSSYGAKRQFNRMITSANEDNVGVVVEISEYASYPYEVMWSCYLGPNYMSRRDRHSRRELKVARVK
jgi:hypothetical protein